MPLKSNNRGHRSTLLYPNSHDIVLLSKEALALKIARHSCCSICDDCTGLAPKGVSNVVLESDWDDNAPGSAAYITTCRCGHGIEEHAALQGVAPTEIKRRGRVAIRLDELLEDENRLLDFEYDDEDITSLRKQMRLPEDALSPLSDEVLSPGEPIISMIRRSALSAAYKNRLYRANAHDPAPH
ncbi:hypothetical protein K439DRAFT_1342190 [Ramaria rubella]|nr:hypothetical protein K439DRAFT_1342190 [Ramaria rubella]